MLLTLLKTGRLMLLLNNKGMFRPNLTEQEEFFFFNFYILILIALQLSFGVLLTSLLTIESRLLDYRYPSAEGSTSKDVPFPVVNGYV